MYVLNSFYVAGPILTLFLLLTSIRRALLARGAHGGARLNPVDPVQEWRAQLRVHTSPGRAGRLQPLILTCHLLNCLSNSGRWDLFLLGALLTLWDEGGSFVTWYVLREKAVNKAREMVPA